MKGLGSSRERWEKDVIRLDSQYGLLVGNVLLSSSFMSYLGPFPSEYRDELMKEIVFPMINELYIPFANNWDFTSF